MKRRCASSAKRRSLVSVASPSSVAELRPRLRTVSIMPGHRELRTAAHADEERIARIAESLAGGLLDNLERLLHLFPETIGELRALCVKGVARLGGDGETGGHGQSRPVISATPAPLPPSRSRIDALPSVKLYTHLWARATAPFWDPVLRAAVFRGSCAPLLSSPESWTTSCPGCLPPLARPHRDGCCVRGRAPQRRERSIGPPQRRTAATNPGASRVGRGL